MRPWSRAAPGGAPCTHTEGKIRAGGSEHEQPGTAKSCSTATAWQIFTSFQLLAVPVPSSTNPQCPYWAPDLVLPGTRLLLGPSRGAAPVKGSGVRAGTGSSGMDRRCLVLSQPLLVAGMVRIGSAGVDGR